MVGRHLIGAGVSSGALRLEIALIDYRLRSSPHRINLQWTDTASMNSPTTPVVRGRPKRPQKVDATIDLAINDRAIERDWKTLSFLTTSVRKRLLTGRRESRANGSSPLYWKYRGEGFPLKHSDGSSLLAWRSLTQWMKSQVALMCLQEGACKAFMIAIHEELADELRAKGTDPKVYLRDRLARCLRDEFGIVPWFLFVIEDRTKSGLSRTKVHVHGVIQIVPADPRRLRSGEFSLRTKVQIAREGLEAARLDAGADKIHHAMKVASGNATGDRPAIYKGRKQERNVWWRKMLFPFFNVEWISYSFKNTMSASGGLPENRLCMSRELNREAQRLWALIRDGKPSP
jgi:hypothetical protein